MNTRTAITSLTLCAMGILIGCSTISMPKGTSKGYSSARFVRVKESPMRGVSNNKALNQKLKQVIAAEMRRNGIDVAASGGDLVIAFMLMKQNNASTASINHYYGYSDDSEKISEKVHKKIAKDGGRELFERGAIIIDLIDAKSSKLIYRNYAVRDVLGKVSAQERNKRIQSAVTEALADFFK